MCSFDQLFTDVLYSLHCSVYFWPLFVLMKTPGTPKGCITLLATQRSLTLLVLVMLTVYTFVLTSTSLYKAFLQCLHISMKKQIITFGSQVVDLKQTDHSMSLFVFVFVYCIVFKALQIISCSGFPSV